jgi:uncharacterized protein (DUF2249 family)
MQRGARIATLPVMNATAMDTLVDVRPMAPRDRHATLFQTWQALADGAALELVNDHDPLPLYYQFACEHGGNFHWSYLERGPEVWRVRIAKGRFPDPGFTPNARMAKLPPAAAPVAGPLILDVRPIFARNETPCAAIDEAVERVAPGQPLVLLVPFEPVPLYTKLGRAGFTHRTEQLEDGTWRIEFVRAANAPAVKVEACGCSHDI